MTRTPDTSQATAYRDLLAAIRDALNIPLPAFNQSDERLYESIQRSRVRATLAAVETAIDHDAPEIGAEALRDRTRQLPITYRPYEPSNIAPGRVARGLGIDLYLPGGER